MKVHYYSPLISLICFVHGAQAIPISNEFQKTSQPVNPTVKASQATEFDRDFAEYFVNHSRASYCPPERLLNWTCICCGPLEPFSPYYVNNEDAKLNSKHVGVYVGYSERIHSAVVVFRGSDYLINFIQDLQYYKVDTDYTACGNISGHHTQSLGDDAEKKPVCKVHSGFYDDWNHVKSNVMNATLQVLQDYPGAGIWVTGHSLGGAIACLCALEIALFLRITTVGLITFGEPRVGNIYFAQFFQEWVPGAMRIVHQDDAVPHLPPQGNDLLLLTAFHHHATEVWQTGTKDDTFIVCDNSGEDPKCANSLTPWDRSIEAHRWYLGYQLHCKP